MRAVALATTAIATVVLVGCKNAADEDDGPSVVPKTIAFEGKVDPKYVGHWKSVDGKAALDLAKDGKVSIDQAISAANGKSNSHVEGTWLASNDGLLMKYPEKMGGDTTLKYAATLSGDTMTLVQPGGRIKTKYMRK